MINFIAAVLAAVALGPAIAAPSAAQFDKDMNTMWEALWHQSGTATRMLRWEKDIKVRVVGLDTATHRERSVRALREVAAEAGIQVEDVTDRADAKDIANVTMEVLPATALTQQQPCQTGLNYYTETTIESAVVQMRESDAARCVVHEAMHVMGVRGHPDGDTVLSYFTTHSHALLPLDKAMLRAWYSPKAKAGMTPFEMLPILAEQLVGVSKSKVETGKLRDKFLTRTVEQMEQFADGRGDVPAILKKCGKLTETGLKMGRMEMSYFLGVAYLQGATVPRDDTQAVRWLKLAGTLGSKSAQLRLAGAGAS